MWIPVVMDVDGEDSEHVSAEALERFLETVDVCAVSEIEFVWLRTDPTRIPPDQLEVAYPRRAPLRRRAAAILCDGPGHVLELYLANARAHFAEVFRSGGGEFPPPGRAPLAMDSVQLALLAVLAHFATWRGHSRVTEKLVRHAAQLVSAGTPLRGEGRESPDSSDHTPEKTVRSWFGL